jgi:hypothetical protein
MKKKSCNEGILICTNGTSNLPIKKKKQMVLQTWNEPEEINGSLFGQLC